VRNNGRDHLDVINSIPEITHPGTTMADFDRTSLEAMFSPQSVPAKGIELHTLQGGSGPLLVLASGWPQSLYAWRKVMPALAQQFRVVAFDPPSLGDSAGPKDGYDLNNIASHIDPLLDSLSAKDCLLVGHDIGAWIGYTFAARRPERVRRLALIDAAIPGLAPAEVYRPSPETMHRSWHFAFNFLPDLPEILIGGRERQFLSWLFRTKSVDWTRAFDDAAIDEYTRIYAAPGAWTGGLGYYRAIFDSMAQSRSAAATKLPMPVLAIGGDHGLGLVMQQSLAASAADLQGAVIADCGHYVPEEQPKSLLGTLMPFLTRT
jgi:pimeloyl-ACP methyl ester carboxylesterase